MNIDGILETKMLRTTVGLIACVLLILCAGCSGGNVYQPETALDRNWGRSYESAKYNQIANPDAGKSLAPVEGLSGVAADNSVKNYDKSFKEKSKEENVTILKLQ
jgi:hypothetical protein